MRHVIFLLISIVLGVSVTVAAGDCSVYEKIGKAGLNENADFWKDYAKLAEKGHPNDKDLETLMAKYKPEGAPPVSATAEASAIQKAEPVSPQNHPVELKKAAERGYENAPPHVQAKVDELLKLYKQKGSQFVQDLRIGGGWNFEDIHEIRGGYSVRLNGRYRATFTMNDGDLKILDIGKDLYDH